jgi:chaperone modulatory protein CbpM
MTDRYSEDEAIAAVALLTRPLLATFVEAQIIVPVRTESSVYFRQVDIVRMELLCELHEQFDLDEDALGVVMSLIDQLHAARGELHDMLRAIEAEPEEVRQRIVAALTRART